MATTIRALQVTLGMDSGGFDRGVAKATRSLDGFARDAARVSRSVSSVGTAVATTSGQFEIIHRDFTRTAAAAKNMSPAINAARSAFAQMASQAAGLPGPLGQVIAQFGTLAYGGAVTAGVLAGITAITFAIREAGAAAREEKEAVARFVGLDPMGTRKKFANEQDRATSQARANEIRKLLTEGRRTNVIVPGPNGMGGTPGWAMRPVGDDERMQLIKDLHDITLAERDYKKSLEDTNTTVKKITATWGSLRADAASAALASKNDSMRNIALAGRFDTLGGIQRPVKESNLGLSIHTPLVQSAGPVASAEKFLADWVAKGSDLSVASASMVARFHESAAIVRAHSEAVARAAGDVDKATARKGKGGLGGLLGGDARGVLGGALGALGGATGGGLGAILGLGANFATGGIGGLVAGAAGLLGGLFRKKAEQPMDKMAASLTAAARAADRLTASLTNVPTGYKVPRYDATRANPPIRDLPGGEPKPPAGGTGGGKLGGGGGNLPPAQYVQQVFHPGAVVIDASSVAADTLWEIISKKAEQVAMSGGSSVFKFAI